MKSCKFWVRFFADFGGGGVYRLLRRKVRSCLSSFCIQGGYRRLEMNGLLIRKADLSMTVYMYDVWCLL